MPRLILWNGLVTALSGLIYAAYWMWAALTERSEDPTSASAALSVLLIGILAALVGLSLRLGWRFGTLVSVALCASAFAGVALLLGGSVGELVAGPASSGNSVWFLLAGALLGFLGLAALGALILIVGVVPRWYGIVLVVSIPAYMLLADFGVLVQLTIGVAWALLGLSLARIGLRGPPG